MSQNCHVGAKCREHNESSDRLRSLFCWLTRTVEELILILISDGTENLESVGSRMEIGKNKAC
jgi:hypothetical protein